ncbi:MAG: ribosomal RNA small subunit methyltransferase A [Planctomycetes bacterium]|nr:ribosomal RNA small subunit methyltransferase A [Planctomycetota bacterium]MBI3844609.1 ribosomal RNA small subunit methyltransferase A [Planctomycetota bacterium]
MTPPRSAADARALLDGAKLRASRRRGQNFLLDTRILDRIADLGEVGSRDVVLEIGTGLATLTDRLAARAAHVITVELDRGVAALATQLLSHRSNVELIEGDALARDRTDARPALAADVERAIRSSCARFGGRFVVVSNLPYSSASPMLLAFLDRDAPPDRVVVLVQKEVADRVLASPGTREYGLLGVCVRYFASAKRGGVLSAGAFWPPPQVRSTILVLEPGHGFGSGRAGYPAFRAVAAALFAGRRKRAATALARLVGSTLAAESAIARAGQATSIRADAVSQEGILDISIAISVPDVPSDAREGSAGEAAND